MLAREIWFNLVYMTTRSAATAPAGRRHAVAERLGRARDKPVCRQHHSRMSRRKRRRPPGSTRPMHFAQNNAVIERREDLVGPLPPVTATTPSAIPSAASTSSISSFLGFQSHAFSPRRHQPIGLPRQDQPPAARIGMPLVPFAAEDHNRCPVERRTELRPVGIVPQRSRAFRRHIGDHPVRRNDGVAFKADGHVPD